MPSRTTRPTHLFLLSFHVQPVNRSQLTSGSLLHLTLLGATHLPPFFWFFHLHPMSAHPTLEMVSLQICWNWAWLVIRSSPSLKHHGSSTTSPSMVRSCHS